MSQWLTPLLPDPPGTWVRPNAWPPDEEALEGFDPTRGTHTPVVYVTLSTPNGQDPETHVATWEAWRCAPVSGQVEWDADGYPRGTATIEIPPWEQWEPARDPQHPEQPATPTLAPDDGIPWAAGPWGTLVQVHYGWRVGGQEYGVRLFDGMVLQTSLARPGRTWVLQCADFTALIDGLLLHNLRYLSDITGPQSQPPLDGDALGLGKAMRLMAREASEMWWPMPAHQLHWDDPDERDGVFDLDIDLGDDPPQIPGDTDMGGRSGWEWVEQWCDQFGVEAEIQPGGRGEIKVREPRGGQDDDARHTLTSGAGGNLIAWTADYARVVTRALMTLHTRGPKPREHVLVFRGWRGRWHEEIQ